MGPAPGALPRRGGGPKRTCGGPARPRSAFASLVAALLCDPPQCSGLPPGCSPGGPRARCAPTASLRPRLPASAPSPRPCRSRSSRIASSMRPPRRTSSSSRPSTTRTLRPSTTRGRPSSAPLVRARGRGIWTHRGPERASQMPLRSSGIAQRRIGAAAGPRRGRCPSRRPTGCRLVPHRARLDPGGRGGGSGRGPGERRCARRVDPRPRRPRASLRGRAVARTRRVRLWIVRPAPVPCAFGVVRAASASRAVPAAGTARAVSPLREPRLRGVPIVSGPGGAGEAAAPGRDALRTRNGCGIARGRALARRVPLCLPDAFGLRSARDVRGRSRRVPRCPLSAPKIPGSARASVLPASLPPPPSHSAPSRPTLGWPLRCRFRSGPRS